jgi:hypothetical protein
MANFCLEFKISPSEYKALTLIEFREFLKVLEKVREQ